MTWWSGSLGPDQAVLVDSLDALCDRHVGADDVERWDREPSYPTTGMDALADAGWAALAVPTEWNGAGGTAVDLAVVHQALARRSLAVAQAYYSLWVLGADAIARLGSPEQQAQWLPRLAAGQARIAFALTEPDSGSDAAALRTRAERDGDTFVVSGQKVFITGATVADRIITAVRTTTTGRKQQGISLLMIDPAAPGVSVRPLQKVGLRSLDLSEVFFDQVRVHRDEVLGTADHGWTELRGGLARERLYLAAISLGGLCDVIGLARDYAVQRQAFGRPIGANQMVGASLVRMRLAADATAGLVRQAAEAVDRSSPEAATAASVAKLFASESYVDGARRGLQVFGGYGFTEDFPIARHYRDCKYLEIGGGTSEIQTLVIARSMGLPL